MNKGLHRFRRTAGACLGGTLLLVGAACGSTSTTAASTSPSAPASASASASPSAPTVASIPAHCPDRVSDSDVSTALGKPVVLNLEHADAGTLLCLYNTQGATPNYLGFDGRLSFVPLRKDPTQADVDAFVATLIKELKGKATVEHMDGVGDHAGWITLTLPNGQGTYWDLAASKGRVFIDFSTFSGSVAQPDRTAIGALVNKAFG